MISVLKYFKRHIFSLILIVVCLFAQAMCDLSLPEYMSNIVNVGLSGYGVENPIVEVLTDDEYLILSSVVDTDLSIYYDYVEHSSASEEEKNRAPILNTGVDVYFYNNTTIDDELRQEIIISEMIIEMLRLNQEAEEVDPLLPLAEDLPYLSSPIIIDNLKQMVESLRLSQVQLERVAIMYVVRALKMADIDLFPIQLNYILKVGAMMLLFCLLLSLCAISNQFINARMMTNISYKIRKDVFEKIESFSSSEYDSFSVASLITRTTNDIQQIQQAFAMAMRMIFYAPILGVGAFIKIASTDMSLSWIIGLGIGLLIMIVMVMMLIGIPSFTKAQKMIDKINLVARETLTGQLVVRAFHNEQEQNRKFDVESSEYAKLSLFIQRLVSLMNPLMMIILNGVTLLIFWFGTHSIDNGQINIGDLMAFMQYGMQIMFAFLTITMLAFILPRANVCAKRVSEILKTNSTVKDIDNPLPIPPGDTTVEFKNVSFRYPGAERNVLTNINLKATKGMTTAIIGSTGSGKSTIINLLPRFFDCSEGEILVNGVNIKQLSLKALRETIGYVSQKAMLFSGTVRSNLLFAKDDASEEQMWQALEVAMAKDFVLEKTSQLDEMVSQGATNFSGGQKQRLSIARALIKSPQIYIFDDTFSALDYKTDASLRKALKVKIEETGATVFIVAQRINSIVNADNIIVLDNGNIVGSGKHEQLLETCEVYKEIAESQLYQKDGE